MYSTSSLPNQEIRTISANHQGPADEELLDLVRRQDDYRAFEKLFDRYYAVLCHQVCRLVHCPHRSEEVVSDVFIRIWKNRDALAINKKVKHYLYSAVRNQAIDYLRKMARERPFNGEIKQDYQSGYCSPADQIIGKELDAKVQSAIDSLPPKGRYIFRLCKERGMKYREIAEFLDISIKTVETHMRRSLIHLRKELRYH